MKKYLFFFLIAITIFTSFIFKDRLALGAISKLVYLKDKLGKLYIERLSFELADDEEQIHTGCTEKYVLKASDGTKWLFKKHISPQILLAYRLANILGIDTPERYRFNISINGINKEGFVQRMIPSAKPFFNLAFFFVTQHKENRILSSALFNGIFCYLLYIPNSGCELLVDSSEKIHQIDLDNAFNAFCKLGSDEIITKSNVEYLMYIDNREYLMDIDIKDIDIDFEQIYAFLKHIEKIDNDWLIKYLKIDKLDENEAKYVDNLVNILIRKKKTLLEKSHLYFSSHPNFCSESLYSASSFPYRIKICKKLCRDILQRCIDLLFSKKQRNKNELSAISSGRAWKYVGDALQNSFDCLFDSKPTDIKNQAIKLLSDAENKLIFMRRNCGDFREKLAITLYIRQAKTLKKYIEEYCTDEDDFVSLPWDMFVQIVQNVHTFKHPLSTDQWFSFITYQTKGAVPIVKTKGEDEYIIGLIKLINKQRDEAMKYLAIAQKEGYAIDEIIDIKKILKSNKAAL